MMSNRELMELLEKKYIDRNGDLNILSLKRLLLEYPELKKSLCYYYGIISGIDEFKINKKSISCIDSMNRRVYLKYSDNNYKMYYKAFRILN